MRERYIHVGLLPNVSFNKVDSTVGLGLTFVAALSSFDFKQLNLCEALDHVYKRTADSFAKAACYSG